MISQSNISFSGQGLLADIGFTKLYWICPEEIKNILAVNDTIFVYSETTRYTLAVPALPCSECRLLENLKLRRKLS